MHDVAGEIACAEGCAETISANVLNAGVFVIFSVIEGSRNSELKNAMSRACTTLAERLAPSLKKWREFRRSCIQKELRVLFAFQLFQISSNILMSLMESWCIAFLNNHFFPAKINLKWVSEHSIFCMVYKKFQCFHTSSLHIASIHISKPLNIRKIISQLAVGAACFLNREMPKYK